MKLALVARSERIVAIVGVMSMVCLVAHSGFVWAFSCF